MSVCVRMCCSVLILVVVSVAVECWEQSNIYSRHAFSYPRDWDKPLHRQSPATSSTSHVSVVRLMPRMEVLSVVDPQVHGRSFRHATVAQPSASVRRLTSNSTEKFYRGHITSVVSDGPKVKRRGHRRHLIRVGRGPIRKHPKGKLTDRRGSKVCARCPSDRAVLAKKGSMSVLMETPPIIPCFPWSTVKKVKQKVLAGPQPGDEVPEGSHKVVIRLYRHRRTLVNCVTRYNVIVRKCGELEVGPGVKADCPLDKAWGAHCNLSCEAGYQLEGEPVTRCTDDLEWSVPKPLCVPTTACPVPVTPEHGQLSCRTPRHRPVQPQGTLPDGSQCHYLCDPGYTIPPALQHLVKIRCVAGSWDSSQDPACVESNELDEEDEEVEPEISAEDAVRFNTEDCPEGFCHNGGFCVMILGEPLCSCRAGFYGPNCGLGHVTSDAVLANTVT